MPVSGDTLLRMIKAAEFEPAKAPRVVGIDDWAWRKGQRYGTIICDLERNRVLDLLPDRNAETVASWLESHPGIEIVARDRAGTYADGARRGTPDATQVADRWHLLQNLGEALRLAVGRHRKAVRAAGKAWITEMEGGDDPTPQSTAEAATKRRSSLACAGCGAAAKPASRVLRGNPSLAAVRHIAAPDRAAEHPHRSLSRLSGATLAGNSTQRHAAGDL